MIKFSSQSKTSSYQQKYNRLLYNRNVDVFSLLEVPDVEDNTEMFPSEKEISDEIKNLEPYLSKVFTFYNENELSFKSIEKKTGIPASSFYLAYKKAKEILKVKLEKKYE